MGDKLRLHRPVNIIGGIGFLAKGDHTLGKKTGETDPVVLKHWFVQKMLSDGSAVVLKDTAEQPKAKPRNEKNAGSEKPPRGKKQEEPPAGITPPAAADNAPPEK
jgi:hypothetical protein